MSERTSTGAPGAPPAPPAGLDRGLVGRAILLAAGGFVALLDSTVIGVAVHTLAGTFGASLTATQWTSTAYLLAMAVVIPATGWTTQRFGATAAWVASLSVFLLGSLASGLAWSLPSLIAFRAVQGAGAGMLFPLMRILVVEIAGRERMGRMMALIAIPVQVAPIIGPVLGGAVIQDFSWRWAFLLNVPIVLVAVVLSWKYLPNKKGADAGKLDVSGLITMSLGIVALIYGLSGMAETPSSPQVWAPLAIGVLLLVAHGVRAVRASGPGIVDLTLFRDRAFTASSAVTFLNNLGLFAVVFLAPLFVQSTTSDGALDAGLILAPQGVGMLVAVLVVGRMVDMSRNPRAMVLGGLAVVAVSTVPFALTEPGAGTWVLAVALFVRGVGLAFAVSPTMITLYHSLAAHRVPAATTSNAITQQLGGAVGTAAVAILLQLFATSMSPVGTFHTVFWVTTAVIAVTAVPAALLPTSKKAG